MNVKKQYPLLIGLTLVGVLLASSCAPSKSTALGGLEDLDEWDLVFIGDGITLGDPGSAGGHNAAELYAAQIEDDLGVTVNVEVKGQSSTYVSARRVLDALRDPGHDANLAFRGWPNLVRESEVVLLAASPEDLTSDASSLFRQCVHPSYEAVDCAPEALEAFAADMDAIYEEILRLRKGSPTIIRTLELFVPHLANWREAGVEDECTRCWEKMNAVIRQTAEEHGVPVAPSYDVINGPNHDQDPRDAGYVMPHTFGVTEAGAQAIADQLRDLGYKPVNQ